jgi:hypothetical protein
MLPEAIRMVAAVTTRSSAGRRMRCGCSISAREWMIDTPDFSSVRV